MDSRTEKMELMLDKTFNIIKDCQSLAATAGTGAERVFFKELEESFSEEFSSLLSLIREMRSF